MSNNKTEIIFKALVAANLISQHFPADVAGHVDRLAATLAAGKAAEDFWAEYVLVPLDAVPLRQQDAESLANWAMTLLMAEPALKGLQNFDTIAEAIALVSAHAEVRKQPLLAAVFHLLAKELDIPVMPKAYGVGRDALAALAA